MLNITAGHNHSHVQQPHQPQFPSFLSPLPALTSVRTPRALLGADSPGQQRYVNTKNKNQTKNRKKKIKQTKKKSPRSTAGAAAPPTHPVQACTTYAFPTPRNECHPHATFNPQTVRIEHFWPNFSLAFCFVCVLIFGPGHNCHTPSPSPRLQFICISLFCCLYFYFLK